MGLWKGKKGSSVFYKIWNSNNKEKQGIREYQPEVRNPQTDYQADQRARMLPAQLVKGALREIVSRSFQGVPYGSKSRLEFLKYALKAEVYPYIPKGSTDPVPGEYLISRGTLQSVLMRHVPAEPCMQSSIWLGNFSIGDDKTWGELSAAIIENNQDIIEGDQLTFVACLKEDRYGGNTYNYYYFSKIIDPADTENIKNTSPSEKTGVITYNYYLSLTGTDDNIAAAAIIHSRLGSDGQYLRSTARFTLAPDMLTPYFDGSTRAATRASYQTNGTRRYYDWPVEDDEATQPTTDGEYTLTGLTGNLAQLNGTKIKVQLREGTDVIQRVYVRNINDEAILIKPDGDEVFYTVEMEVFYLRKDQVSALDGYPVIIYQGNGATRTAAPAVEEPAPAEKKTTKKK